MNIAILGWGSLIWDPRDLLREGIWQKDGPELKIEFSRISNDCRLTLVIDEVNGIDIQTYYVLSPRSDIEDTIIDLLKREGTTRANIGFIDLIHNRKSFDYYKKQVNISEKLIPWMKKKNIDGIVWTSLPPSFKSEYKKEFTVDNAIIYLSNLPKSARSRALKYIKNAPIEVRTPLRTKLKELHMID